MSFNYNYNREIIESLNCWDIENPLRVDGNGMQIFLADEARVALGNMDFNFKAGSIGDPSFVQFEFEQELTPEQVTILDTTVYNHKNNIQ